MEKNTPSVQDAASAIGNPVDVATRGSWKATIFGIIWLLVGSVPAIMLVIALSAILWERKRDLSEVAGIMIPLAAGCALAAWFTLATAVRRFRAAFEPGCYFRASPAGVAFRIPGRTTLPSLFFGYRIDERHARWDEVKTWYPYVHTHNGIPTESAIVIDLVRGGKVKIDTMYFSESRKRIAENIALAMSGKRP